MIYHKRIIGIIQECLSTTGKYRSSGNYYMKKELRKKFEIQEKTILDEMIRKESMKNNMVWHRKRKSQGNMKIVPITHNV